MKKIIIHIGAAKCGSSAIQNFIALNRNELAKKGVLVPSQKLDMEEPFSGEQIWFFENIRTQENRIAKLKQRFALLEKHMDAHNLHTLILSAENISNTGHLASDLEEAVTGFDPMVVFYVRRQDDYLLSSWQQWHLKGVESIERLLADAPDIMFNWYAQARPWADAFGDARFKGRAFRRDKLVNGDVVDDFMSIIGLNLDGLQMLPEDGQANRSFNEHLGDMAHRIQDIFDDQHDNLFFLKMAQLIGEPVYKTGSASHLMSLEDRMKIYHRFDESNASFKTRFLPEYGDGPLFDPPADKNVRELSEVEKLRGEIDLLTRAVYKLAQER
ncbi:MAG: hypothetical protein L3J33_00105 [Rhodobacteraceae bacterium]|nr:hypothetical protein [Paracoccaceae bacterium]